MNLQSRSFAFSSDEGRAIRRTFTNYAQRGTLLQPMLNWGLCYSLRSTEKYYEKSAEIQLRNSAE